jgi:hypothetical protein
MPALPDPAHLAYLGIAAVGLFGVWKLQVAPRVARWRATDTVA